MQGLASMFIFMMVSAMTIDTTVCDQAQGNFRENVWLTFQPHVVFQGDSVSLDCRYNPAITFMRLQWFLNDVEIQEFFDNYEQNNTKKNHEFSINGSHSILRIPAIPVVNVTRDSGNYTCQVVFSEESKRYYSNKSTAFLKVHVPVKDVTIFDETNEPAGDVSYVIAGEDYNFTCVVPNINLADASIKWTLGTKDLKGVEEERTSSVTSTVTLSVTWANHNEVLSCTASSNIKDRTSKSSNVTLDVKVLPTSSSLHLSDENGLQADGGIVSIDKCMKLHIFFFKVTSTRPKPTINCYLGEERLEHYERITGGGENELTNTTSVFVIKTSDDSHNKQLKCCANTPSDSKNTHPSIRVTIKVVSSTAIILGVWSKVGIVAASFSLGLTALICVLQLKESRDMERMLKRISDGVKTSKPETETETSSSKTKPKTLQSETNTLLFEDENETSL